jgi:hypothetical protein
MKSKRRAATEESRVIGIHLVFRHLGITASLVKTRGRNQSQSKDSRHRFCLALDPFSGRARRGRLNVTDAVLSAFGQRIPGDS